MESFREPKETLLSVDDSANKKETDKLHLRVVWNLLDTPVSVVIDVAQWETRCAVNQWKQDTKF